MNKAKKFRKGASAAIIGSLIIPALFALPGAAYAQVQPAPNPPLEESCGLDIVLVIDSSGSIDSSELQQMKDAFNGFVDALLPNETEMAIVEFDTSASVTQSFTGDASLLHTAIDAASSGGFTNWDDAMFEARSLLPNRPANPDLILFASDGNPNRSGGHGALGHPAGVVDASDATDLDRAIEEANAAKGAGAHIKALGIGNNLDISKLEAISSPSDVITSDFDTLADTLAQLADELCEEPPEDCDCDNSTNIILNDNKAVVINLVGAGANTGGNGAGGSSGGDGGDGGDINNGDCEGECGEGDVEGSTTGNGGDGGNGDEGGVVLTGNASSTAGAVNVVNTNITRVDRCCGEQCDCEGDCSEDLVVVANRNRAVTLNGVGAGADTGDNGADGSSGGSGSEGGEINNDGGGDVEDSDTGSGGTGGDGGLGGYVETGDSDASVVVINVVNRNDTRIRR